jgi:CheY-like chemotaxis protein
VLLWEQWEPHLIFMDMRMPVVDGYEATRQIKATTRGQATVIVALTASALEEDRMVILSEGCDAYMRKPFQEDELLAVLHDHLGVQYIFRELGEAEASRAESDGEGDGLAEKVRSLPPSWREQMRRAAIVGDLEQIQALIGEIAEHAADEDVVESLGASLSSFADAYEHDRILALLDDAEHLDE